MRCASMVSISSMAAESRAAGVIQDFRFENGKARERRKRAGDATQSARAQIDKSVFSAKYSHIANSASTPANHASERCRTLLEVTKIPAWAKRVTTNTHDNSTITRSTWRSG